MTSKVIAERYELLNVLGAGGMGTVYKALDTQTEKYVAVKIIDLPNVIVANPKNRLLVEVSALAKLNHPSIAKLIDFVAEGSIAYIVMELVEGKPLSRTNDIIKLIRLIKQVSDALSVVHESNIIHRDIKPDNILVVEGENPNAVIVDFGVAKVVNSEMKLTSAGVIIGTINYMSPEQVLGTQIDTRTDLYSLGCVLYEALTGEVPFQSDNLYKQISMILSERPKKPSLYDPKIPQSIETIVMRLLEKSPDGRFKNATELSCALEDFLSNESPKTREHYIIQTRSSPFVGRAKQLSHFENILNEAFTGKGSIVNIYGDQGVGKSRLLHEWKSMAVAKGAKVVSIETQNLKSPLSNFLDQVVSYAATELDDNKEVIENASLLAGVSQKISERFNIPPPKEEIETTSLVVSARNFIETVFKNQTLVILQDEVKDMLLASVLKKLTKNIEKKSLIIVDSTIRASDSVFTAAINQANTIGLTPFTVDEVSTLAKMMFGKPINYQSIEKIYNASGGNPQYAIELLTDLGKGSTTIEKVPETLKQLFKEKIEKLSEDARLLLDKIAILNQPMPLEDLQPIIRIDSYKLIESVNELISKGLLIERFLAGQSDIALSSPLIEQVILEESSNKNLMRIYNELATSLEIISSGHTKDYYGQIGELYIKSGQIDKGAHFIFENLLILNKAHKEAEQNKEILKIEPYISQIYDLKLKTNILIIALISKTSQANIEGVNLYIGIFSEMIGKGLVPKDLLKNVYLELAFSFVNINKLDEALEIIEKIKKNFSFAELENNVKYWKTLLNLYIKQHKHELAEEPAKMLVLVSNKTNDKTIIASALNYQAIVHSLNKKYNEAINMLEQVRQIGNDTNNLRLELRALNNIAGAYFTSQNYNLAEETLKQALVIAKKLELAGNMIEILFSLLDIAETKHDMNGKRSYLDNIGQLLSENPNSQFLADYLLENIKMSISDANFNNAQDQAEELVELAMKTNRPNLIRLALEEKAKIYLYIGNYEKALLLCEQIDELLCKSTLENEMLDYLYNLFRISRLCVVTGNTKKATLYFEKASKLLDSYAQANDYHKLERDLTRFTVEWHMMSKDNDNKPFFTNKKKLT